MRPGSTSWSRLSGRRWSASRRSAGRARAAGSEFVLACDLRFASRENTLIGQFEVGAGVFPGAVRRRGCPAGRPRSRARDPARGRRSRRTARGTVRVRQPAHRRCRARREVEAMAAGLDDSTTTRSPAPRRTSIAPRFRPTTSSRPPCRTSSARSAAPGPRPPAGRRAGAQHRRRPRAQPRPARRRGGPGRHQLTPLGAITPAQTRAAPRAHRRGPCRPPAPGGRRRSAERRRRRRSGTTCRSAACPAQPGCAG